MKSTLALVLVLALGSVARADDPMPEETASPSPTTDEAGIAGENAAPAPEPAPVTSTRARMTVPTPSPRAIRPRIKDDGESRLDKKEDTVAGGTHWRIKTAQGAVHVWIPGNYDRATAGTVVTKTASNPITPRHDRHRTASRRSYPDEPDAFIPVDAATGRRACSSCKRLG